MDIVKVGAHAPRKNTKHRSADVPGIVITDGGHGHRADRQHPRVRAFVYGEELPTSPTLPFGRWKQAS